MNSKSEYELLKLKLGNTSQMRYFYPLKQISNLRLLPMSVIQLFRRSTSNASFVPEIDGLRFFCIFLVMVFHLNTAMNKSIPAYQDYWKTQMAIKTMGDLSWWVARFDLGVKVFFAISGYILGMPFIKYYWFGGKPINLKQYFIRRLTRLEPPFVISLLVLMLM
ncbi:MAG: acyltransferase, partial [Chitinophagaceae bacterium]|nr:acyltransferase [Chitinophagaceae bacterium]